ncbi:unnamed protein product [[Candida] boidinii]|uniref:Unnamed protein product n=1 Tax=Candida boidinii TaxID=5477 RepID=A0A9W6T6Q5_CANBO|nr:unnamed protein product [[Candida] boidinii]
MAGVKQKTQRPPSKSKSSTPSKSPEIQSNPSIPKDTPNDPTPNPSSNGTTVKKTKTIRTPGSSIERVAQACDRCRSKKTRCDGKRPQCSNCAAVGLECKISDKLSRRAFPRGYTETLEERIRELEFENKKLQKLIDLKNEQFELKNKLDNNKDTNKDNNKDNNNKDTKHTTTTTTTTGKIENPTDDSDDPLNDTKIDKIKSEQINNDIDMSDNEDNEIPQSSLTSTNNATTNNISNENGDSKLNIANLNLLNSQKGYKSMEEHLHDETCGCGNYPHSVHNRPVSIAGSVDIDNGELSDDDSLLQVPIGNGINHGKPHSLNGQLDNYSSDSVNINNANNNISNSSNNIMYNNNNNNTLNNGNFPTNGNQSQNMPIRSVEDLRSRYGYNNLSFEQSNAPGAAAAVSLQNKLKAKNFMNLANLIASSIPRSTEETLFIPALLAKIVNVHSFNSNAPFLTSRSIALLKESFDEKNTHNSYNNTANPNNNSQFQHINYKYLDFNKLKSKESVDFFENLNLPNHLNLDMFISIFFDTWNTIIPILNKQIFMNNYLKFNKSRENGFNDGEMYGLEKFGELLLIITTLAN